MLNIKKHASSREKLNKDRVVSISGECPQKCMQCGTCSAVCPMMDSMKITIRQAMHLIQLGKVDEVIKAKTGEYCAACHSCTVRCPRDIDIAKVMEAVRQLTLRENKDILNVNKIPRQTLRDAPQIAFVSGFRKLSA